MQNTYYIEAKESVTGFLKSEFSALPDTFVDKILGSLHNLCIYEEEGQKVRPTILITSSINTVIKAIPSSYKIEFFNEQDDSTFDVRLKSLMSFCNNEWMIYISIKDNQFSYGICKAFNSLKEPSMESLIFSSGAIAKVDKLSLICLDVVTNNAIMLRGLKGESIQVNFSLTDKKHVDNSQAIKSFIQDSVSKIKTTQKKIAEIATLQENIFNRAIKSIHGTICVIVDRNYVDNGLFQDGIWLQTPIDLSKLYMQARDFSENRLNNLAGLFIDMLNFDGITIIDNTCKIRAYNVFVQSDKNTSGLVGGARKRAAYSILGAKNKKIIGVYFQSQDGDIFYETTKANKTKR